MQSVLITGGAGFIGQNLVHAWRAARPDDRLTVVDAMTYAANVRSLEPLIADRSIQFVKGDIRDAALMRRLFDEHKFTRVAHLAAESHVDRSIVDPEAFLQTNVLGTFTLLKAALDAWRASGAIDRARFLHVSTDEVYGSLGPDDPAFSESSPYRPNSPYAASKAASDHLVRSFVATYGMPALITNCSNNYGPYQHPEKLIPLMIIHALEGKPLPVYGDGSNVRDWLHVSDHCEALMSVIERGRLGETYNVGGGNERNNRDVVGLICDTIDEAFAADQGPRRALSILSGGVGGELPLAHLLRDRPAGPRSPLCDRRHETRDRTRQSMQRRLRDRTAPDRSLVPRPGRLVARRDQRRLPGVDRQELRLPDRGLNRHAHPRAQRGLSALPGLALSPPARARERLLRDADGRAEREPVRGRGFLFEEFRRVGPHGGGNPRQQSLAAVRMGARARHGGRAAGSRKSRRAPRAARLAAARRDTVQADAEAAGPQGRIEPQARPAGRADPAGPDRGFSARPGAQSGCLSRRYQLHAPHQGHRQPDPDRPGRNRALARRGLDASTI